MMAPDSQADDQPEQEAAEEAKPRLNLEVVIDQPGACQRHVTVSISREDIDRYLADAFDELVPKAEVRGFRAGRAPRKLVENHFREQIREQVKGALLLDSLQQVSEDHEFSAISEPDFNYKAIDLPEEGPLKFEFDLEVRPDFDLPEWKGMEIRRPVREVTEEDIDRRLFALLGKVSRAVPVEDGAADGDYMVVKIRFLHEGNLLSELEEETLRLLPKLNFGDGTLDGFDDLMRGSKVGDVRTGKALVSDEVSNEALAGKEVDVEFHVERVVRIELPVMSPAFLEKLGGFESEQALRDYAKADVERQLKYFQQQRIREQITSKLTANADWELPPDLLRRQARRELDRVAMEMQSSGFSREEIDARRNQLRQNALANTARALREHFILERLAEEHDLDAEESDYDLQIQLIAMQENESPRRVRARLEKKGLMDTLRNQIIESKVINLVAEEANFEDVPMPENEKDTFPVQHSICGDADDEEIPEAQTADVESLRQPVDRT
jgi:trigger factor